MEMVANRHLVIDATISIWRKKFEQLDTDEVTWLNPLGAENARRWHSPSRTDSRAYSSRSPNAVAQGPQRCVVLRLRVWLLRQWPAVEMPDGGRREDTGMFGHRCWGLHQIQT